MIDKNILTAASTAVFLSMATLSTVHAGDLDKASDSAPLSTEHFINADKDHDGYLNPTEFGILASMVDKQKTSPEILAKLHDFKAADADHDGKVSARELGVVSGAAG
jgi:EF hand